MAVRYGSSPNTSLLRPDEVTVHQTSEMATIQLDSVPELRIGGEADSTPLYRVADATRTRDGSVVVLDGASREVRFFTPDGTLARSTGGRGEGPGESLPWIRACRRGTFFRSELIGYSPSYGLSRSSRTWRERIASPTKLS